MSQLQVERRFINNLKTFVLKFHSILFVVNLPLQSLFINSFGWNSSVFYTVLLYLPSTYLQTTSDLGSCLSAIVINN